MRDYFFYFSYARGNSTPYLKKFVADLSQAMRERAGLALHDEAGFFEHEHTEWGDDWPRATAEALQKSRTMVCLLSPTYFNSEFCGKEWQIFRMRQQLYVEHERAVGNTKATLPPVIKPVLWLPLRGEMPRVVADTQHVFGDLAAPPNKEGLLYLLKLRSRYRREYEDFLIRLAEDVLNTTYAFELPPLDWLPPLNEVKSAFAEPADAPQARASDSSVLDGLLKRISGEKINIMDLMEPPRTEVAGTGAPATGTKKADPKVAEQHGTDARAKTAGPFSGVFISYRRNEAAAYAGRLYDRLAGRFGREKVFIDTELENVDLGEDFVEAITSAVESCSVMIVLISHRWSRAEGKRAGRPDYVRLEVSKALERKIRVIPILIQGASMPEAEELPEDLAPLVRRNYFELRDTRWERDVEDLINTLERILKR